MGKELVVGKRVYTGSRSVPRLLTYLGIPFVVSRRRSFWFANEDRLEYLFHDLQQRSRAVLAELHPDRGGDPAGFRRFQDSLTHVRKAFYRKGVGLANQLLIEAERQQELQPKRKRRQQGPNRPHYDVLPYLYEPERSLIITAVNDGFPTRYIVERYKIGYDGIYALRRLYPNVKCPCGRLATHDGPQCSFRKTLQETDGYYPRLPPKSRKDSKQ